MRRDWDTETDKHKGSTVGGDTDEASHLHSKQRGQEQISLRPRQEPALPTPGLWACGLSSVVPVSGDMFHDGSSSKGILTLVPRNLVLYKCGGDFGTE